MNKKMLSLVVIVCTIITVGFMFYLTKEDDILEQQGIQQVQQIQEKGNQKNKNEKTSGDLNKNKIVSNNQVDNKKEVETKKEVDDKKEVENKKEIENTKNVDGNKVENKKTNIDENKDNSSTNTDNQTTNNTSDNKNDINKSIVAEESKSVFKVDKNTIMDKINFQDKLRLMNITRKLSIIDYGTINKNLKGQDEYNCARDIFRILKSRLSSKDYNEVKEILKPYIDVDAIEKSL